MPFVIRTARHNDIPVIMAMFDHSRQLMRANGNTEQWVNGYPGQDLISTDIKQGNSFIIEDEGTPVGTFAFILGQDPTYQTIEQGKWIDDETEYGTIHRLACIDGRHGIAHACFEWCRSQAACLRADTHSSNRIMLHILEREGFCRCGIIHVADGSPRIAYELMTYPQVDAGLKQYCENEILPRYDAFDAAHKRNHALTVAAQSMLLASHYPQLRADMAYAVALYHDTGLCQGRDTHHLVSGAIIRNDKQLRRWFTNEEIETMAQAAEDHRASSTRMPRSLYGMIVAEADRDIDPLTILRRTIQYGKSHYPQYDKEGHWQRTLQHLHEKYAPDGYLKLYIPYSRNAMQLKELHALIADTATLRLLFDNIFDEN